MSRPEWLTRQRLQVFAYIFLTFIAIVAVNEVQNKRLESRVIERVETRLQPLERRVMVVQRGPKGEDGPRGRRGADGPAGPPGAKGADGAKGSKGDKGSKGSKGAKGDQGPRGNTGPQGSDGAPGVAGPTGDVGKAVDQIAAGLCNRLPGLCKTLDSLPLITLP